MNIDLGAFSIKNEILLDEDIIFPLEYTINSGINELINVHIKGRIYYNSADEMILDVSLNGIMILPDSITLEDIELPFNLNIEEVIEKNNEEINEYFQKEQNTLDIMGILWQNIVLEVPMRFTKNESLNLKGEGWELRDENEQKIDPRLASLQELLDEKGKE